MHEKGSAIRRPQISLDKKKPSASTMVIFATTSYPELLSLSFPPRLLIFGSCSGEQPTKVIHRFFEFFATSDYYPFAYHHILLF